MRMSKRYVVNAGKIITENRGFRNFETFYNYVAAIRYFKGSPARKQIDAFGIGTHGRRFAFCLMYKKGRKIITQPREYANT